eukprot:9075250-Pyramimonas_sp.AAC.1
MVSSPNICRSDASRQLISQALYLRRVNTLGGARGRVGYTPDCKTQVSFPASLYPPLRPESARHIRTNIHVLQWLH